MAENKAEIILTALRERAQRADQAFGFVRVGGGHGDSIFVPPPLTKSLGNGMRVKGYAVLRMDRKKNRALPSAPRQRPPFVRKTQGMPRSRNCVNTGMVMAGAPMTRTRSMFRSGIVSRSGSSSAGRWRWISRCSDLRWTLMDVLLRMSVAMGVQSAECLVLGAEC